ncbi:hypothetical protein A2U01_0034466, partial [Trifolium medium]|nr:hypothetical protein [Trifolium medium]
LSSLDVVYCISTAYTTLYGALNAGNLLEEDNQLLEKVWSWVTTEFFSW